MFRQNTGLAKRQAFRQQIRKKQIQQLFGQRRKHFENDFLEQEVNSQAYIGANSILIKRSMSKNQLNSQLPQVVKILKQKLRDKTKISNIQFALCVSSNILRDDIDLESRQLIYNMCMQAIICVGSKNMSVLVQTYFYESVFGCCYQCLQQNDQIKVEKQILPILVHRLENQEIDMSKIGQKYSQIQCRSQICQSVIRSLSYFYSYDPSDHNYVLLYKIKRTPSIINDLIRWASSRLPVIKNYLHFDHILSMLVSLLYSLISTPIDMSMILSKQTIKALIEGILLQILSYEEEGYQKTKGLILNTLNKIVKYQYDIIQQYICIQLITHLVQQLERSVDKQYQICLACILTTFINTQRAMQEWGTKAQNIMCYIIRLCIDIIAINEQHTDPQLLHNLLELLLAVLNRGFEQGSSQYSLYFSSIGAGKLIDVLYVKIKDQDTIDLFKFAECYSDLLQIHINYIIYHHAIYSRPHKINRDCQFVLVNDNYISMRNRKEQYRKCQESECQDYYTPKQCKAQQYHDQANCPRVIMNQRYTQYQSKNNNQDSITDNKLLDQVRNSQYQSKFHMNETKQVDMHLKSQPTKQYASLSLVFGSFPARKYNKSKREKNTKEIDINQEDIINLQQIHYFSPAQIQYLLDLFKIGCQKCYKNSRLETFSKIKQINRSINLAQWILFCRNIRIFQYFSSSRDIIRMLTSIFKRFQNKQQRLLFEQFCRAFHLLINSMNNYTLKNQNKINMSHIKKFLGLSSQKDHIKVIEDMKCCYGIKSMENLPKIGVKKHHVMGNRSNTQSEITIKIRNKYINQNLQKTRQNSLIDGRNNKRQSRVNSILLKNLQISNVLQLNSSESNNQNIYQILKDEEDKKYMKQYLKTKRLITQGILRKVQKKYHPINKNMKKKTFQDEFFRKF